MSFSGGMSSHGGGWGSGGSASSSSDFQLDNMNMGPSSSSSFSTSEWSSSSFSGNQNEENLIGGIMGYYEIDRSICLQGQDVSDDWNFVEIDYSSATNTFTWTNRAGVSWTMSPISGSGGWDTTQLTVGNDNPYFMDGYTSAGIEWVSSEGITFFHQPFSQRASNVSAKISILAERTLSA